MAELDWVGCGTSDKRLDMIPSQSDEKLSMGPEEDAGCYELAVENILQEF